MVKIWWAVLRSQSRQIFITGTEPHVMIRNTVWWKPVGGFGPFFSEMPLVNMFFFKYAICVSNNKNEF
jgi:hypothetical protein